MSASLFHLGRAPRGMTVTSWPASPNSETIVGRSIQTTQSKSKHARHEAVHAVLLERERWGVCKVHAKSAIHLALYTRSGTLP